MSTSAPHAAGPQVSVVMIFLDAERFIAEAIESVLAQTYERWELLLVDDGSADAGTAIARRYAESHRGRIRYLEHDGHVTLGTGASRNVGIRAARGEYVAFLDADDVYLPRRLERHMTVLANDRSVGTVVSASLYWHSWRGPQEHALEQRDEIIGPSVTANVPLEPPALLVICLTVRGAPMPCTCDITFSRKLALADGGIPVQFVDQYEDQVLICQLLLKSHVVVLDECLAKYRQHVTSLTGRARLAGEYRPGRAHEPRSRFMRWLRDYLDGQNIHSSALDAQLQRELWPLEHPRLNRAREVLLDAGGRTRRALRYLALRTLPRPLLEKAMARYVEIRRARVRRRSADALPVSRK